MQRRIPGSMRTRHELSDLIEGKLSSPDARGQLVDLAARLIIEEALEAETRDTLGRGYYEHGGDPGRGHRNGNRTGRLRTAEGAVEYTAPQVAGGEEPFRSRIRSELKGNTERLERLATELLARGLSTRDIEDAFRDESGSLLLSRTAVSEIGERLWEDYLEFSKRDLGGHDVAYLFVDGIAERIRPGQRREPVLAAWGVTSRGRKVLLGLMAGSKEDHETVSAFFQDMRNRNLGEPLLVVSDGAAGIIKAIETCFPVRSVSAALRTGCATSPARFRRMFGPSSRSKRRPRTRPPQGRSQGTWPGGLKLSSPGRFRVRSPASSTTSRPASPICGCR